jgi:predicted nicotinamide N-methyase
MPVPGVEEITLALADDPFRLWVDEAQPVPYWAFAWPGGQVLARWWLDHPELVRGRRVVDLGCASGLVGIAAAMAGAESVTCVDVDPVALAATSHNAQVNGVHVDVCHVDLLHAATQPALVAAADVTVAGDLLYEPELARATLAWLADRARAGAWALAGDAGRAYAPRVGVHVLHSADVPVHTAVECGPTRQAQILQIRP